MANKPKEHIPNRLLEIREQFGCTQKELAEILGVSQRQICNYETSETSNLPIDKAMIISKKFNCSLDWIYCKSSFQQTPSSLPYSEFERTNFFDDIRKYIRPEDNTPGSEGKKAISVTIPENYWKYMKNIMEINLSSDYNQEKKSAIAKLNGIYENTNASSFWKWIIPYDSFFHTILSESTYIPFITDEDIPHKEITEEEQTEAEKFVISLFHSDYNIDD